MAVRCFKQKKQSMPFHDTTSRTQSALSEQVVCEETQQLQAYNASVADVYHKEMGYLNEPFVKQKLIPNKIPSKQIRKS